MIAALFVETGGVYWNVEGIEPWDIERDARTYSGPHRVIAHPPCQLWGSFAHVNYARYGGEHNRPGNDGGCFASALANVRRFGGVLEHPAFTKAWSAHGLTQPALHGWKQTDENEWVCEVWQSAYGHKARKRTWLFYVGTNPFELRWERKDGTHQCGWHDKRGRHRNKPTVGKKEASRTPIEFRDELIRLVGTVS